MGLEETTEPEKAWIESLVRKPRILVVDDDEMVVSIISQFCERMNVTVDKCYDAHCAMQFYSERSPYDAILIDLRLGPIGGDEIFRRIRANDHSTPIAIVSGWITEDVVNQLLRFGMVTFIKKPIDLNSPQLVGFFKSIGIIS